MTAKRTTSSQRSKNTKSTKRRQTNTRSVKGRNRTVNKTNAGSTVLVIIYDFLTGTYFGRVALAALLVGIIIFLNILVSGDRFNWFFILTGIEIIVAAAGGWLLFLLRDEEKG